MPYHVHCVAFWLVPSAQDRASLTPIVARLASEHSAPLFMPHVTLLSGTSSESLTTELCARVLGRAAHAPAIQLAVRRVRHSDDFFETVVLELEEHAALGALRAALRVAAGAARIEPSEQPFQPHVSLIYKQSSKAERERIASTIEAPSAITCDCVAAVVPGSAGWEDVSAWRVLCSRSLAG